jgi:hypothetical protein
MSTKPSTTPELYGLVARFASPEALLAAARETRDAGYIATDAHTPIPVHGLAEALGMKRCRLAGLVLAGGTLGCLGGLYLQYWISAVAYPINVGGRPYFSWPAFIPVVFECTILGAALTTIFGMLALNKLPQPYHPVFNTPDFDRASNDGFFLAIEAADPQFDRQKTRAFLQALHPMAVHEVEP